MSYIGPLTQDLLNTLSNEFNKKETKEKISKLVIDPLLSQIIYKYLSYGLSFITLQLIIIALLIYLIIVIHK